MLRAISPAAAAPTCQGGSRELQQPDSDDLVRLDKKLKIARYSREIAEDRVATVEANELANSLQRIASPATAEVPKAVQPKPNPALAPRPGLVPPGARIDLVHSVTGAPYRGIDEAVAEGRIAAAQADELASSDALQQFNDAFAQGQSQGEAEVANAKQVATKIQEEVTQLRAILTSQGRMHTSDLAEAKANFASQAKTYTEEFNKAQAEAQANFASQAKMHTEELAKLKETAAQLTTILTSQGKMYKEELAEAQAKEQKAVTQAVQDSRSEFTSMTKGLEAALRHSEQESAASKEAASTEVKTLRQQLEEAQAKLMAQKEDPSSEIPEAEGESNVGED